MSTEQIMAQALALPAEAKATLAERLLRSLDDPGQREIDAGWAEEAERRIDAFDRGEERSVSAEQAMRDARARFR